MPSLSASTSAENSEGDKSEGCSGCSGSRVTVTFISRALSHICGLAVLGGCLYALLMALSKREVTFQLQKDWLFLLQLMWNLFYQEAAWENDAQRSCFDVVQEKL